MLTGIMGEEKIEDSEDEEEGKEALSVTEPQPTMAVPSKPTQPVIVSVLDKIAQDVPAAKVL